MLAAGVSEIVTTMVIGVSASVTTMVDRIVDMTVVVTGGRVVAVSTMVCVATGALDVPPSTGTTEYVVALRAIWALP